MEVRQENVPLPAAARAAAARIPVWKKLLFALVPCVVVFALAEIVCRVTGAGAPEISPPSPPDVKEVRLTAPDGRESVYKESVYVGQPVRTNEKGFRDWLYETANAEGALRLAAVGDSFTFGDGLAQADTWLARLGDELTPRLPAGRTLRTMNFGRRGANTADEVSMLEGHVLPFRPDAVVLGFTVFNDAETTVTKVAATKAVAAREQSAAWKTMRWLHDASWAVNFVSDRLRRGRKRSDMAAHVAAEYADAAPGWVECRASLGKFAAACRDAKVPLVVVLFPVHHRDPSLNDWAHYEFRGVHDQVRAALSPWQEAVVVDMTDHLADLSGRRIWIEGNGHPDAEYARRVAAALVDPVARALQLPPR